VPLLIQSIRGRSCPTVSEDIKAKLGHRNLVRYDDGNIMLESAEKYGGRPAYNWEVAGVVAVLCSENAQWITGSLVLRMED
jgi:NAD(P)-dependent dehydrogenase (short-subunit alcohol dehydrogenase family)